MAQNPELRAHLEWLGYVQPVGLVVSPVALHEAQAAVGVNLGPLQERFQGFLEDLPGGPDAPRRLVILDLENFTHNFLGWQATDLVWKKDLADTCKVPLSEYGEVLEPDFALRDAHNTPDRLILLVQKFPWYQDLDQPWAPDDRGWKATPQARVERLLRESHIPIGLIYNGTHLRLVYAPAGESSEHITFPVASMAQVGGRPILGALTMLLGSERLFSVPTRQRLPAILEASRKFQSQVSTQLAGQVLEALYELVRGFQAADERTQGELLRHVLARNPDHIYEGLLTVLLRLVFLLYAEDRGLLPEHEVYREHYSIGGLFSQLREDIGRHPDTMDHRFGAWARLLTLFRLIHDGGTHKALHLPARAGGLFDPDRFAFLEGRTTPRVMGERIDPPMVSDGVVWRAMEKLLVVDGERLSYRSLDVEQIGSVYETMMGFTLRTAKGRSLALRPKKPHGAPTVVDLDELLALAPDKRAKWLRETADQELTGDGLKSARTVEELEKVLEKKVAREATRASVPKGTLLLQPSLARRKSGSHYTPRSLTAPIVTKALAPLLKELGPDPKPEQILFLKVCDPAMGSGAFLVEAGRQLATELVKSWRTHRALPNIPADEDEILHARRLVAQRCLYGVDKNPMAVDLAKLSLWLATLAKDHPFTFLDHALRWGDSLVGLTRKQIINLHWLEHGKGVQQVIDPKNLKRALDEALALRERIRSAGEAKPYEELRLDLKEADEKLDDVRLFGDLVVHAWFGADTDKKREERRAQLGEDVRRFLSDRSNFNELRSRVEELRTMEKPVPPLHWEIEFPEVFGGERPGFDAIVGNPPFAGKNSLIEANPDAFPDWLKQLHEESHGNADLVAHFFRRAFGLLRQGGAFGLIATKTIRQGDTRSTGLRWICMHGGTIYAARTRRKWPGAAAVVVSEVHCRKTEMAGPFELDGRVVEKITAYLFHAGGHEDPARLKENEGKSFQGSIVLGMGFTFDDMDKKGVASPIAEMERLIAKDPRNKERIFPYIGGEEVNDSPTHAHHRYVINFGEMPLKRADLGKTAVGAERKWVGASEEQQRDWLRTGVVPLDYPEPVAGDWPDLLKIVEERVKPQRDEDKREVRRKYWWRFGETAPALFSAIHDLDRVLIISRVTQYLGFVFAAPQQVFSERLVVLTIDECARFAIVQCRLHEVWALCFGSTLEDRPMYSSSDCFETFPFPHSCSVLGVGRTTSRSEPASRTASLTESVSSASTQKGRLDATGGAGFGGGSDGTHRTVSTDASEVADITQRLEETGRNYMEHRARIMQARGEGLTEIYNRFHNPEETEQTAPDIVRLRRLHEAMDRVVLDAYSWTDLQPTHDFFLDYEDDEEDDQPSSRRKKPWRYRWPDEFRDEVLARLLALNQERARGEQLESASQATGSADVRPDSPAARTRRSSKSPGASSSGVLFDP